MMVNQELMKKIPKILEESKSELEKSLLFSGLLKRLMMENNTTKKLNKPDCSEIFYIQNTIKRDREVMGAEYSLDWQLRKTITQLRGGEQK